MLEIADKVVDGIKLLRDTAKKMQNAELQGQIADLMLASADLKAEMADLKAEVLAVREENSRLRRKVELRSRMEVKENVLYLTEPVPGYNQGPFCPICFETNETLINVWRSSLGSWHCPHCQKDP